jgi:hypothetical protein
LRPRPPKSSSLPAWPAIRSCPPGPRFDRCRDCRACRTPARARERASRAPYLLSFTVFSACRVAHDRVTVLRLEASKPQVTTPAPAFKGAGFRPGDTVRAEALGAGRVELTRLDELLDRHSGALDAGGELRDPAGPPRPAPPTRRRRAAGWAGASRARSRADRGGGRVRTLDALHLGAAQRVGATMML